MTTISSHKRIAKNTLFLYIRMGITLLVQLYTSRVVLKVLGVENFGIWSIVATLILSISFITGPLSSSTQRFLSFERGRGDNIRSQIVFSQSIIIFLIFGFILLILLESIGLWLLNFKLHIPENDVFAANIIYQTSIISFIIILFRTPYDSMIIANEAMSFYAYIAIIDVVLKLLIVYLLQIFNESYQLIAYGFLTLGISTIISTSYVWYCKNKFKESSIITSVS